MNKKDLVNQVAEAADISKAKANEAAKVCSRCHKSYHGDPYFEHGDGRVGV